MADPGFLKGGATSEVRFANLLFGIIFAKKLHENEKNLTERGARVPRAPRSTIGQYHDNRKLYLRNFHSGISVI